MLLTYINTYIVYTHILYMYYIYYMLRRCVSLCSVPRTEIYSNGKWGMARGGGEEPRGGGMRRNSGRRAGHRGFSRDVGVENERNDEIQR